MFCIECGYSLPDDAGFCPKCGAKVQSEESVKATDNSIDLIEMTVISERFKGFLGFFLKEFNVFVDSNKIGVLPNGGTLTYKIIPGKHCVSLPPGSGDYSSAKCYIWINVPKNNAPITLTIQLKDEKIQLLCEQSHLVIEAPPDAPPNLGGKSSTTESDSARFSVARLKKYYNEFRNDIKKMPLSKSIPPLIGLLIGFVVAIFLLYHILKFIFSLPIVLLVVVVAVFLLYLKYGKKLITKYDAHFASKTGNTQRFQMLAIAGSIAYGILFFFPWVKVIGQGWLAFFGYGQTDGFNPIGLLRFVATFTLGLFGLFGEHIDVGSIDPMVVIAIVIFFGILIKPISSAWNNIKNVLKLITKKPDDTILDGTSGGPLTFIVIYYLGRGVVQSYITDVTSLNWIGSAAGNLYGNLIELSTIPWIMLMISIINWYCAKRYIRSRSIEPSQTKINTEDNGTVTNFHKTSKDEEGAKAAVLGLIPDPEVGRVYDGIVKRITDFGAFVEILPGKEGLVHISKLSRQRVANVSDVVKEGDKIKVKLLEIDKIGRLNFSYIDALDPDGSGGAKVQVTEAAPEFVSCSKCGTKLPSDAAFCDNCGAAQ